MHLVAPDAEALSERAAVLIVEEIRRRPSLLLCVAAGSSPRRTYRRLGETAAKQPALFARLRVLKLDEWAGLPKTHPATCEFDLREHLLDPLRIATERYEGFQSDAADPVRECERVAGWLARNGPIDLCVLGLGANGHLAMNEPGEALCPGAHVAQLAPASLEHPMLADCATKPTHGLTLGIADILRSRRVLLLVCGPHKRAPLRRLFEPGITSQFPASFLWTHPDLTVLCDAAAAADIPSASAL